MKINRDDLSHVEDILPKPRDLTDDAVSFARKDNLEDIKKSIEMLAGVTQFQNIAIENLCSAIAKLQKPDD